MKKIVDCKELALKKVNISGNVIGKFGTFEIEQTFVNNTNKVLEVGYTFPISESATVIGFEIKVGDQLLFGKCKEKKKAKKEYKKNLAKGNSAYLLEEQSDNIFSISIGKLAKNEEVVVKIKFIDKFEIVDNKIKLFIPTLVPPKYNCNITDKLSYGKVKYTVDFNIKLAETLNVNEITSATHKFNIIEENQCKNIEVLNYDLSRDFKLDIELTEELSSNALIANTRDGNEVLCLSFMPEILDSYEDSEKDYIFLIDVSGSMYGEKLEQTKHAVIECLKQLDEGDKFNIIAFESTFEAFSRKSLDFNSTNLKKAIGYVDSLVDKGGTEIFEPIQYAIDTSKTEKIILLFTDGEVGNEEEIIDYVDENIGKSRIFPFGIDTNVNSFFINDLARVGNGKAEFIMPGEKIDDKIIRTFARIQTPILEDLTIDYGNNKLLEDIQESNTLFNYEFFNVFAKIEQLNDDITLRGRILDSEYSWKINKDSIVRTEVDLETIYAKEEIDELERYVRFSENRGDGDTEGLIEAIIEIAEKYNINSKYTSFITVYERDSKIKEMPIYQETTLSSKGIGKRLLSAASFFSRDLYSSSDECFDFDGDCCLCLGSDDFYGSSPKEAPIICHPKSPSIVKLTDLQIPDFIPGRVTKEDFKEDIENTVKCLGSKKKATSTVTSSYIKVLQNKVEQLYISAKSTLTYILYAIYYLSIKDKSFDFSQFVKFLKYNSDVFQSDEKYMQLLCECYKLTQEDTIYKMLSDKYKQLADTKSDVNVDIKELSDTDIKYIVEANSIKENLNEILWYLYNKSKTNSLDLVEIPEFV